jgi:pimeloyl-ACP methyl ester carboxylesterase
MVCGGAVGGTSPAVADSRLADTYIDQLTEEADTPALDWADCDDGFYCATAIVPLDYHRPNDEQIHLAVIKLPASDPGRRIGTLFVNFGGPGQSGVNRLRDRARWPWLFSEELRSRFDLVSWDPRGVARSAPVNCFSSLAKKSRFFASAPGLPVDAQREPEILAWSEEYGQRCQQRAGRILEHVSSTNTARDLELLRRGVGDPALTYHGISYGTQLGAIYANLFPGRVRAMALDGSLDFDGNVNGHGSQGATAPLDYRQGVATAVAATFQQFLSDCSAAGPRCAFSPGDPRAKWAVLAARSHGAPVTTVDGRSWTYPEIISETLVRPTSYPQLA